MTPQNIAVLSKNFAALPIDTIERLENTVDLVFEKVLNNYISIRFQEHILRECLSSVETDKAQRMDSVKKLAEIKS